MLPGAQLFTPSTHSQSEHTILFSRLSYIQIMSVSSQPTTATINRITAFIAVQDGSETAQQLLPSIRNRLATGRASPPAEEVILEMIRKVQANVKHWHEKESKKAKVEQQYAELQERMASSRMTASRKQQIQRDNIDIIHAYERRKVVLKTPQIIAQEKLVSALAELREKNILHSRERKRMEAEAKQQRKDKRREEKQARKEKEAAEKADKRAAEEKKRDEEIELRGRIKDQRALQQLEAAAKVMDLERKEKLAADRHAKLEESLQILVDSEIAKRGLGRGQKRARREEIVESEEDKENIEPEGQ